MNRPKLSPREIWLLIFMLERCGLTGRMTLKRKQREWVTPLWRRELVEMWWRQMAGESARGPYFSLTIDGHRLASAILAARDERRRKEIGAQLQPPPALAA